MIVPLGFWWHPTAVQLWFWIAVSVASFIYGVREGVKKADERERDAAASNDLAGEEA